MEQPSDKIYLLHLWPTERGGLWRYRVVLDDVLIKRRWHFPDIENLTEFLRAQEVDLPREVKLHGQGEGTTDDDAASGEVEVEHRNDGCEKTPPC